MTREDFIVELSSAVYQASVGLYEKAEHEGVLHGNGHHRAQELARLSEAIFDGKRIEVLE